MRSFQYLYKNILYKTIGIQIEILSYYLFNKAFFYTSQKIGTKLSHDVLNSANVSF